MINPLHYRVSVPEGTAGAWRVERFTITPESARHENMMAAIRHESARYEPGTYTRLLCGRTLVASDTPDELREQLPAIRRARGVCLINGLGLGAVLHGMACKPQVERVIVVEISPEVIELVAPHYRALFGSKIQIVQADAFTYRIPRSLHFGVVWHDIWIDRTSDNYAAMDRLERRYRECADWQGCWGRRITRRFG